MSGDHSALVGGAPFATPAKVAGGFFDALMKKDSSVTPAGAAPNGAASASSASGLNAAGASSSATETPSKSRSKPPPSGPSMEDMQLLMDQLSSLSQTLADQQMQNVELRDASTKTQALYDQMRIERDFMIAKCEAHEKEMARLREKISFSALDATNEQLKQLKQDAQEMTKENEALKSQNQILYQNYADINADLQNIHDAHESQTAELKRLLAEKTELESARDSAILERNTAQRELDALQDQVAELTAQAEKDRAELETARIAQAVEQRDALEKELASTKALLHDMTTDRNRCRKMAESIQLDMKKLFAQMNQKGTEQERLAGDNQRLREDLARKSKSLQDALTALAVAMETQSFRPAPQPASETILVGSSSSTVSGRDLMGLQLICNRLSETIKEKDDLIGVLRKQCVGLGKRVIELEAGTLPDFSEKAFAAEATATQAGAPAPANAAELPQTAPHLPPAPSTSPPASAATDTPGPSVSPLSPGSELLRSHSDAGRRISVGATSAVLTPNLLTSNPRPDYSAMTPQQASVDPERNFPKLSSYSNRASFTMPADGPTKNAGVSSAAASAAQAYLAGIGSTEEHDLP